MNVPRSAFLALAMTSAVLQAKEPGADKDPLGSMVDALLHDHVRLAQQVLADRDPSILCEKEGQLTAASRYGTLPRTTRDLSGFCHRVMNLPDHPAGSVVCTFDTSSSELRSAATTLVMDMSGDVESERSGYTEVDESKPHDFSKDPRCKAVFHEGMGISTYEDAQPGAGCGSTPMEEAKPLSARDLVLLKGLYCKD